jgi:FixJ family two-component response regulator
MDEGRPYVLVVDDRFMRESPHDLLRAAGLTVQMFASAHEFLTSQRPEAPTCRPCWSNGSASRMRPRR